MARAMFPTRGKGEELRQLLCRELDIPQNCRSFSVHFAVNEVVLVRCEYMPRDLSEGEAGPTKLETRND